jgi:hypothetical protein
VWLAESAQVVAYLAVGLSKNISNLALGYAVFGEDESRR